MRKSIEVRCAEAKGHVQSLISAVRTAEENEIFFGNEVPDRDQDEIERLLGEVNEALSKAKAIFDLVNRNPDSGR